MANNQLDVFVHKNFNKNEIRNVSLENRGSVGSVSFGFTYSGIPQGATGSERGIMYYDTNINRLMIWNGDAWKIAKYLDDRDFTYNENVFLDNIWVESSLIPNNFASASVSNIVSTQSATMSWVTNSYEFIVGERVVPESFGSFYAVSVTDSYGNIINKNSIPGWNFFGRTLFFPRGFPDNIGPTNPPILKFWRYDGRVGDYNFLSGYSKIIETSGLVTDSLQEKTFIPLPNIRNNNILSVTINGVIIYRYYYDTNINNLIIDNSNSTGLGYDIEPSDIIRIETNLDLPTFNTNYNPRLEVI